MKKIKLKHWSLAVVVSLTILVLAAVADGPPRAPENYAEGFEEGGLFFDDAVGVVHIRQSHSTAETDYALGITAADGENYARLLVQPTLASVGGINGDQDGTCKPGAAESDNTFSCGGPFTEWGLPFGGFDGSFDAGIPIGGGTTTSIDIYLDMAFAATNNNTVNGKDYRFDWDSDLLDRKGQFLQDYIFNVATGNSSDTCGPRGGGGFFVVEASTNSQRSGANAHSPAPPNPPQVCISSSGWYTFTHVFTKDRNNNLEVDMKIATQVGNHLAGSWTLHPTCMVPQVTEGLCNNGAPLPSRQ